MVVMAATAVDTEADHTVVVVVIKFEAFWTPPSKKIIVPCWI